MAVKLGAERVAPPRSDAYTGMLIISLIALLVGCVFLYLDYSSYTGKPPTVPPSLSKPGPALPPQGGVQGGAGGAVGAAGGGVAGMGGAGGMQAGGAMGAMGMQGMRGMQ